MSRYHPLFIKFSILSTIERYVRIHLACTYKVSWLLKREQNLQPYELQYAERILRICAEQWRKLLITAKKMNNLPTLTLYEAFLLQLVNFRVQLIWIDPKNVRRLKSYIRICFFALKTLWDRWYDILYTHE